MAPSMFGNHQEHEGNMQEKMKKTYEELNAVITREIKTQSVEKVLIQ